ncbi:MAG: methionine sulfoxide reductase [Bacteroidetes bacterium HGW-Bacteroidetes-7]|jgi:peptide methionine sulfoxide reductase msrA/msrB|nr:MAG: methionine sulfoxide reductase [Bacteroidetes bacterium HGW-Bacteroidetes-7]
MKIKYTLTIIMLITTIMTLQAQNKRVLTPEEKRVIIDKGTERPFTGKYHDHKEAGTYHCKQCNAPLFISADKFDSECGWPSFDDEIPGAITRHRDADGMRTEIVCSNCEGHLGHVFTGERFTKKNLRHCVNSVSLEFVPEKRESAIFAGGCFWGVEHLLQQKRGVISVVSGYIGGSTASPDYRQVSSGTSGHAEAVEVIYDASQISYRDLAKLFFEIHDPTQKDKQGPDIGTQYRSEIFYNDQNQKVIAEELIGILKTKGLNVQTKVTKASKFFKAEDYHQDYYVKKGTQPYCHIYTKRF